MNKNLFRYLPFLFLVGCAGMQRDCQSCNASAYGADWVIVQYQADGHPFNCWQLRNASVVNEHSSDGIWWSGSGGHLVHISGWYNRVQVHHDDWEGAARAVGVEIDRCKGGRYISRLHCSRPQGMWLVYVWVAQGTLFGALLALIPDWDRWWHPWALAFGWPLLAFLTASRCLIYLGARVPRQGGKSPRSNLPR